MEREEVERLLRVWQGRLHLDAWDLRVEWVTKWKEAGDALAQVESISLYDQAWVIFDTKILTKTDADAEKTVIHELVHLVDRGRSETVKQIEGSLPTRVYELFARVEELQTEGVVDKIATILYEVTRPTALTTP